MDRSRSTPLRRSKAVAIAWEVNDEVMIASASTPGVKKSIRLIPSVSIAMPVALVSPTRTRTGTMIVTSSCSPLRRIARASKAAWARTRRWAGAARPADELIAGSVR